MHADVWQPLTDLQECINSGLSEYNKRAGNYWAHVMELKYICYTVKKP